MQSGGINGQAKRKECKDRWMDGWADGPIDEAVVAQPLGTTVRYSTPQFWVRNARLSMERSQRKEKKGKTRSLTGARVRDKVRCLGRMLVAMLRLGNMTLIGSLFPLVLVSYEEI